MTTNETFQHRGHWLVFIAGMWEIRKGSKYSTTWAWTKDLNKAKEWISERNQAEIKYRKEEK